MCHSKRAKEKSLTLYAAPRPVGREFVGEATDETYLGN